MYIHFVLVFLSANSFSLEESKICRLGKIMSQSESYIDYPFLMILTSKLQICFRDEC